MDYRYTVRSVSIDEVYNSIKTPPATRLQPPPLNAEAAQPPPKTQPLPSPTLTPLTPPLKNMEELPSAESTREQKTPLLTATAQPKYNSISSSPLILSGKPAVPAPPPLSLLSITMQKPLHIEY